MDRRYEYGTEENRAFLASMTENLLNFGHRFPSSGGGSYWLGDTGEPWTDRPRETWITGRMAHVYGIGMSLSHPGSEELLDAAIRGLAGELCDDAHGGWYPGIKADGSILPDKQCYAHAFVILAASGAFLKKRPGAEELLKKALALYDEKFWDEEEGFAVDTWNTEFTVCDPYRGLNANMHTVEAFLAVADVTHDEKYRERAGRIIRRVLSWAEANEWRIPEHFDSSWNPVYEFNRDKPDDPFKPYGATPGHGIEWARLILQWANSAGLSEKEVKRFSDAAEQLYGRAVSDGWNADGAEGFVYTTDWNGAPVIHDRMHWVLAEAINTSSVLFRETGKECYKDDFGKYLTYLDRCVLDHEHGSWFHQLDRENRVIGTVWPGKSDLYHALQATLIPYAPTDLSIAVSAAEKQA